jgi:hypothetical protein
MKILNHFLKDIQPSTTKETSVVEGKNTEQSAKDLGVSVDTVTEDDMIKEVFESEKVEMTKKDLKAVKAFLKEMPGELSEKLESLKLLLSKNISVSTKHLKQVHLALHMPMPEAGFKFETSKGLPEPIFLEEAPINKVIKKSNFEISKSDKMVLDQNRITEKEVPSKDIIKEDDTKELAKDSKSSQIVFTSEEEIPERKVANDFENTERSSEDFLEPLTKVFEALSEMVSTDQNQALKFVEVQVTKEMYEAKELFNNIQKNIVASLEALPLKGPSIDAVVVLENMVDKLDHILMKSDITLYTDMKTERDLLASSSLLDKARVLLHDKPQEAFEIIKSVKDKIEALTFTPKKERMFGVSQRKFEHLTQENIFKNEVPIKLGNTMNLSPRSILETFRGLGLNHEMEISEKVYKDEKSSFKSMENLKSILLKLESSGKDHVVKTLDHITGQQLINKLEVKSQKQQLLFHLPVEVSTGIEDMRIHVNGQKNQQKLDWQNSRLYFVIHLDSIGDTGILVEVKNSKLSMTIKNDKIASGIKSEDTFNETQNRLEAAGFEGNTIKFEALNKVAEKVVEKNMNQEGFDVTI